MKFQMLAVAALMAAPASAEPFDLVNDRIYIPIEVNGHSTDALLDSAAEASVIDQVTSKAIGLGEGEAVELKGSGGSQVAHFLSGVSVRALGQELKGREMVVSDLSGISRRLAGRTVHMILGREMFDAARIRIDYAARDVRTVSGDAAIDGVRLPLVEDHGVEAFPLSIGGRDVKVEFDTGNGSGPLISRALASQLKLKSIGKQKGGGLGKEVERDLVLLPSFTLAGKRYRKIVAAVDDQATAADLNFGTSMLKDFVVTADFANRALYLAPAAHRNHDHK